MAAVSRFAKAEAARRLIQLERTRLEVAQAGAPRYSLSGFVEEGWPEVEPTTPYIHGRHIDVISEHLQAVRYGQIQNLVINIPFRYMKSLLVSVFFPAWIWTEDPGARFIFTSYSQDFAIRDSVKTRDLVTSDWYQERWGGLVELTGDQNEKRKFQNTKGGFRMATSIMGAGTGEGADYVIADDPHKAEEVHSLTLRERVVRYWRDTMSSRGGRYPIPKKIIVMQRLHEQDLSGFAITAGGYVHLRLPWHFERKPWVQVGTNVLPDPVPGDWRTEPGELLWPERFGPAETEALARDLTAQGKASQMEQRPSPPEGGLFKRHQWGFWEPPNRNFGPVRWEIEHEGNRMEILVYPVKLPFEVLKYIQSWDFTFKGSKTAPGARSKLQGKDRDFVSGQVWCKTLVDAYLMDRIHARADFPGTLKMVRDLSHEWPEALQKYYEDAANGPAVAAYLRSEIQGLIPVPADGEAMARAEAVTYLVEGGHAYFPHPSLAPWVMEVIEEAAAFPNATNDDDVTALVQALRRLFPVVKKKDSNRPWPITQR